MGRLVIGISELEEIILNIKLYKGIDFSDYAYSSLKRRIENFMLQFNFVNVDELIHKINKDNYFFDLFLESILVDTTEMFRDPDFWKVLKINVLKRINTKERINVLVPECNSGEELYSLLIVLEQLGLIDKTKVCVSSLSDLNVQRIKNAAIELKKMEINSANFERFDENGNIFDFFRDKGTVAKLKASLLGNVEIIQHNLNSEVFVDVFDLILYRNKTIYYNQHLQSQVFKKLAGYLSVGGFIAIGIKEAFVFNGMQRMFSMHSESERIYKKIVTE